MVFLTAIVVLAIVTAGILQAGGHKQEGVDVGPGEMGIRAVIIPGPPLAGDAVMPDGHADYPRGMTCAECHDVSFDGITSATMQFVNNFGALENDQIWQRIVEFLPGRDGMVHISQIADYRVEKIEDEVHMGDEIMVMVTNVDPQGKVRLSRQAVLEGWTAEEARSRDQAGRGSRGGDRRDSQRRGGRSRSGGSRRD